MLRHTYSYPAVMHPPAVTGSSRAPVSAVVELHVQELARPVGRVRVGASGMHIDPRMIPVIACPRGLAVPVVTMLGELVAYLCPHCLAGIPA